jgi:hypothetical protein
MGETPRVCVPVECVRVGHPAERVRAVAESVADPPQLASNLERSSAFT